MREFKNEQEHIDFLKPICAKYRQFLIGKKNLPHKGGMSTLAKKYIRGE